MTLTNQKKTSPFVERLVLVNFFKITITSLFCNVQIGLFHDQRILLRNNNNDD